MSDWSDIIRRVAEGDDDALRLLLQEAQAELRRRAHEMMRRQRAGHTFQTTALVNEACRRVLGRGAPALWESPEHFLNSMGQVMRRILCEHARARKQLCRDPGGERVPFAEDLVGSDPTKKMDEWLAVSEALDELTRLNETQARIVELRYFGGLTIEESARVLGLSEGQVSRAWARAKDWFIAKWRGRNPLGE